MQNLKSILEKNIDIERQRLYKEKEYRVHREYQHVEFFRQEVAYIQQLFDDQNPLYSDFYLLVEYNEDKNFEANLCTVREIRNSAPIETEYLYRGHVVKKQEQADDSELEYITQLSAIWLVDQKKWAIKLNSSEADLNIVENRSDLIKVFLGLTIKDVAKILEREADTQSYT